MTRNEQLIKAMEYSENKLRAVDPNKLDDKGRKALEAFLETFSKTIRELKDKSDV